MRKLFLFAVISCLFFACDNDRLAKDEFRISGNIRNGNGKELKLVELAPKGEVLIASILLDESGHFAFKQKLPYPSIYLLRTDETRNFITFLPDTAESILFSAVYDSLIPTFTIAGSENSEKIVELQKMVYSNRIYLDSMGRYWDENKYSDVSFVLKDLLDKEYEIELQKQKQYQKQLIYENPHSIIPIYVMFQRFGSRPVFVEDDDADLAFMTKAIRELYQIYPSNPHVLMLYQRYERLADIKKQEALEQKQIAL